MRQRLENGDFTDVYGIYLGCRIWDMVVSAQALPGGKGGSVHVPDSGIRDDLIRDHSGREPGTSGSGGAGNGVRRDRDGAERMREGGSVCLDQRKTGSWKDFSSLSI